MMDSLTRTNRWICLLAVCGVSLARAEDFPTPVNTEKSQTTPMSPEEVVKTVKLPPGFELTVMAAEPQVQNPIAITTDERGRLWVAENYSWAGGGAGGFDGNLRDRIVILEDTDGDGRHDKRTVFWDNARKLTSLEVGYGGVWAICLPNLLFIPDKNRDDQPDGPPQIVLDGLDEGPVGHTPANGLKWGPDGWLYARHGILATSSIGKPGASDSQRFKINTGVWRYHPTRDVAEAVMHGMTNSWGFDFDEHGEMFVINTVIGHLWHVVPGAHTERMFGLDMSPHSYKLIGQVADHVHWDSGEAWADVRKGVTDKTSAAGGGHAHIGLMIYQGDNWPDDYRNRLYTLNLHGQRINTEFLVRKEAGYTAKHGPDWCFMADPWFRGMDLITAPDGSVIITDWSDTGECHDHDGVHRTSGRIYRLAYGQPKPVPAFDLTKNTAAELAALQNHSNTWWARQARRVLTERFASHPNDAELVQVRQKLEEKLPQAATSAIRQRYLETVFALGETREDWWLARFQSSDEHERVAAIKFLLEIAASQKTTLSAAVQAKFCQLADTDVSGLVQLYLASVLQKLPYEQRWELAEKLARRAEFANDRMLPLMVWYGIEPAVPQSPQKALQLVAHSRMPLLTECVSRRLTLEIERDPKTSESLLTLAASAQTPFPDRIIVGMGLALNGWQKAAAPKNWAAVAKQFAATDSEELRQNIQNLNVVFGDGRALEELRKLVTDGKGNPDARRQALRSLLLSPPADYVPTLFQLLGDRVMAREAIRGLAFYDHPQIPAQILNRSAGFDPAERVEMIQTLTSRPAYAAALLAAVREKRVAATELSAFHARQIRSFENEQLTKDLTELWGDVRVTPAEKRALIEQQKGKLTADNLAKADLSAGRGVFQKNCANCHILYGTGRRLGPDLTGSNRKNLDYLLENLLDPSASVGADFRTVVVTLASGRVLNGVISEQNERTLTLQSAQESITIDRQEIDEMHATNVSLMPDGLLQNLTPEQVRDLTAYLMATEQVPLPPEAANVQTPNALGGTSASGGE